MIWSWCDGVRREFEELNDLVRLQTYTCWHSWNAASASVCQSEDVRIPWISDQDFMSFNGQAPNCWCEASSEGSIDGVRRQPVSQTYRLKICPPLKVRQDGGEQIYEDAGAHERKMTCELSCRKHKDIDWTCHTRAFVHSASWGNFEKYSHTWIVIAPSSLVLIWTIGARQIFIGNWARWECLCLVHGGIDEPNNHSSEQMV